jgi:Protein of unknown function (DUF3987)
MEDPRMSSFPLDTGAPAEIARTQHLVFAAGRPEAGWPELDVSILEEKRGAVPPFPLDLLAQPWRDWVSDTASSAGAPTDYVVQAVLAALAGLCGAGVAVRITPVWSEPLVLWQAVVGEPSSGKSSALASTRRLLDSIEAERRVHDDVRQEAHAERAKEAGSCDAFVRSQVVVADTALEAIADVVSGNPRGVILWRDEPTWLAQLGEAGNDGSDRARWLEAWSAGSVTLKCRTGKSSLHLERFPVSILATTPPDRLKEVLEEGDDGPAARFLYAWPGPQPYCPLANGKIAQDDEALKMLRRLSRLARTPDDPLVLSFDRHGVEAFDGFLAGLHADRRKAVGLEAVWLGKGRSTVARLAGALELLAWSGSDAPGLPGHIGREQVEAAAALWTGYFRPHARAVFDRAMPTTSEDRVRRVARWLKDSEATVVSREDIRCRTLGRTVNAEAAQQVLYRLDFLGFVRPDRADDQAGPGRPARRWQVNPALVDA